MPDNPRRRPGGRSARVRDSVHRAVTELLAEQGPERLRIADVARRSGVHPASIYRRWGTPQALALEVAAARLDVESPVPDTGSLVRDLLTYAMRATESIRSPDGLAFLRATIAAGDAAGETLDRARDVLIRRGSQFDAMLDRARDRGEPSLDSTDVVDGILAPIYLRTIFGIGGIDRVYLLARVETVVRGAMLRERRSAPVGPEGAPAPGSPTPEPGSRSG